MIVRNADIKGIRIIEPRIFEDARGYFYESFNEKAYNEAGIHERFIQDNQSCSSYGTIRGLHMQIEEHAQSKLIRVLEGAIFDVAVDLRDGSPTFGQWFGQEISEKNKFQMLIPKGFCHGFSVLTKTATVLYKCDKFYHPTSETGLRFNDPDLKIDWKIPSGAILVSDKDQKLPFFKDIYK